MGKMEESRLLAFDIKKNKILEPIYSGGRHYEKKYCSSRFKVIVGCFVSAILLFRIHHLHKTASNYRLLNSNLEHDINILKVKNSQLKTKYDHEKLTTKLSSQRETIVSQAGSIKELQDKVDYIEAKIVAKKNAVENLDQGETDDDDEEEEDDVNVAEDFKKIQALLTETRKKIKASNQKAAEYKKKCATKEKDIEFETAIFQQQLEKTQLEAKLGAYSSVQTDFGAVLKDKMDMTEKEQKQLSDAIESIAWPTMKKKQEQKLAIVKEKLQYLEKAKEKYEMLSGFNKVINTVSDPVNQVVDAVLNHVNTKASIVSDKMSPLVNPMIAGASNAYAKIDEQVGPVISKTMKRMKNNAGKVLRTMGRAKKAIKSRVGGISDMFSSGETDTKDEIITSDDTDATDESDVSDETDTENESDTSESEAGDESAEKSDE